MKKQLTKTSLSATEIRTGDLLLAKPFIPDELYSRTAVLIVQHDETGTAGLILNRPSAIMVNSMFDMLPVNSFIHLGGPMEGHLVTFIHDIPDFHEALPLGNGLFWGGSHDYLEKEIVKQPEMHNRLIFCAGLTTWEPGDLEVELQADFWWKTTIEPSELFYRPIEDIRNYALLRDDSLFGVLHEVPDPVLN